jgi:hypothetical protein
VLPQLAVSRYANQLAIIESGLVPVRMTIGHPRFKLYYKLGGSIQELAPDPYMLKITDRDRFRALYRQKLYSNAPVIVEALHRINAEHGGRGLVLLCFEDLSKPGQWCHRQMLAEFFEEHGVPCPELPSVATPAGSKDATPAASRRVANSP